MGHWQEYHAEVQYRTYCSKLFAVAEEVGTISLENHDLLCYFPYGIFCQGLQVTKIKQAVMYCPTARLDNAVERRPWNEVKSIVDMVHRHVCVGTQVFRIFVRC